MSPGQKAALSEWLSAAETLRDFVRKSDMDVVDPQVRRLVKEVLRAENRVRAVNGYPPRMFTAADS